MAGRAGRIKDSLVLRVPRHPGELRRDEVFPALQIVLLLVQKDSQVRFPAAPTQMPPSKIKRDAARMRTVIILIVFAAVGGLDLEQGMAANDCAVHYPSKGCGLISRAFFYALFFVSPKWSKVKRLFTFKFPTVLCLTSTSGSLIARRRLSILRQVLRKIRAASGSGAPRAGNRPSARAR